jgi:ribosomal protein S16
VLGTYDPIPKPDPYDPSGRLHKDIKLDITRAKYWIGVGAQPTDTVWRLLSYVWAFPVSNSSLYMCRACSTEEFSLTLLSAHQVGILPPKYPRPGTTQTSTTNTSQQPGASQA